MRTWILACLVLSAALAGCSDDRASSTDDPDEDLFEGEAPKATDTTGIIRGVVLDETVTPVVGATVAIASIETTTTTNDKGAFAFSDLDEGSYILAITKPGFEKVQTSTSVIAGLDDPDIVKVQLMRAPGTEPFIVPHDYNGRLDCSFKLAIPNVGSLGGNMCHELEVDGTTVLPTVIGRMALEATPDFIQSELNWESTQQLGDNLDWMFSWSCDSNAPFFCDHSIAGTSPLVNTLNATEMASDRFEGTPFGADRDVLVRVFSATSGTAADMLGLTIQQDFQGFTFAFYNFLPDEGWVFSTDGEHDLPA